MEEVLTHAQLQKEDESSTEVAVTREDQDSINAFSTLHQKSGQLEEELEAKRKEAEDLADVSQELELADEDELVPYRVGDCFAHLKVEEVVGLLEERVKEVEAEIEGLEEEMGKGREEMESLKVKLYAKFGKAINLDV